MFFTHFFTFFSWKQTNHSFWYFNGWLLNTIVLHIFEYCDYTNFFNYYLFILSISSFNARNTSQYFVIKIALVLTVMKAINTHTKYLYSVDKIEVLWYDSMFRWVLFKWHLPWKEIIERANNSDCNIFHRYIKDTCFKYLTDLNWIYV